MAPVNTKNIHNVVIIGSGPAAHTAAIYLGRAQLKPVLYEGFLAGGVAAGGQLTTTTEIENFPGFPEGLSGTELMDRMRAQSIKCETTIHTETIARVDLSSRPFKLWTEALNDEPNSEPILAKSLIICTGATAKRMNLPGEDTYWNRGMSACAVCDGAAPIFRNKPIAVIGAGDSACEEATFLTRYSSKVYLIVRRNAMRASKIMQQRVLNNSKIEVLWSQVPVEAVGNGKVITGVKLLASNPETGSPFEKSDASYKERLLDINGMFYAIGHVPNTGFLKDAAGKLQLKTDSEGYIVHPEPGVSTQTTVEGVYASGDVVDRRYRQAITAAGMGCASALDCERWLEVQEEKSHSNL